MLCKRDVSVSHSLCGKGLWEEQLSGGQIRLLLCLNFHLCLDVALKVMLLVLWPCPASLRGAAAGPSCDFSAQGAEPRPVGQIWGQRGPSEAIGGSPQVFSWRRGCLWKMAPASRGM